MRTSQPNENPPTGLDVVIRWLAYAALVAMVLVIGAAQVSPSRTMQVISSFITFFSSVFLSFVVTRHYAQVTAREELKRLAEAAGSRIFLLSVQMRQLVQELNSFSGGDGITRIFIDSASSQIDRLASQADLSVEDLERIADVDLALPAMRDAAQTRVEATTKREQIPCPHCSELVDITIGTAANATKHSYCDKCNRGFVVHRVADGSLKVSHTGYFRIDCPNTGCTNDIGIRARENEWGTIIRNCFECYARVQYDLDKKQVESFRVESPLDIVDSNIEITGDLRRGPCPGCGYSVIFQDYKNSRGEQLTSCPRCTKLVRVVTAT